jgi:Mg-chelatase subunit ChlI
LPRLSINAQAHPPNEAPTAVSLQPMHVPGKDEDRNRGGVDHASENVLRRASAAHRQTHHGQRGHHQEADAAAEIAAVDGNQKLRDARGARRQMRFAGRQRFAKKTAPGEQRRREQHQPRHETGENRRRRREEDERAKRPADEADDE